MVTHYLTLLALTRELDAVLRSATILEVFTQLKNEMVVAIEPARHAGRPGEKRAIHVSVDPK